MSGEYLLKDKILMIEWSNAEINNFKIVKLTANELVLRDEVFKLIYYYYKQD